MNSLRYSQTYIEKYKIMQGSTYDTVFVDMNDMVYNRLGVPYSDYEDLLRRLYVGCSRAKKELIISFGK